MCSAVAARRGGSGSPSDCRASTPAPDRFGFPRSHRLTTGAELRRIGREGKRLRAEHLDVRLSASLLLHPRVGLIVPRHAHSAVERNQLKRRLRELARTRLLPGAPPVDVVIRAKRSAYDASFDTLAAEIGRARQQIDRFAEAR